MRQRPRPTLVQAMFWHKLTHYYLISLESRMLNNIYLDPFLIKRNLDLLDLLVGPAGIINIEYSLRRINFHLKNKRKRSYFYWFDSSIVVMMMMLAMINVFILAPAGVISILPLISTIAHQHHLIISVLAGDIWNIYQEHPLEPMHGKAD